MRGASKAFVNGKELAYSDHDHDINSLSNILSVTKGGTGVTSLDALKNMLGINSSSYKIVYGRVGISDGWASVSFSQFTSTPAFVCSATYSPSSGVYLVGIRIENLTTTYARCFVTSFQYGNNFFNNVDGTLSYIAIGT